MDYKRVQVQIKCGEKMTKTDMLVSVVGCLHKAISVKAKSWGAEEGNIRVYGPRIKHRPPFTVFSYRLALAEDPNDVLQWDPWMGTPPYINYTAQGGKE